MKSLLLATGEENNLPPLTDEIASPMVPIANRPAMIYAVELLARYRMTDVFVSLYRHGAAIEEYFGNGQRWNLNLEYLLQSRALGSAGSIKRAQRFLPETFLVAPANAIIDLDIDAAINFHQKHGGSATMILADTEPTVRSANHTVGLDANDRILTVSDGPMNDSTYMSTGAYIFEPEIFAYIPDHVPFDCYAQLIPELLAQEQPIYGYRMDGYWNPLDSFEIYQTAQKDFLHSLQAQTPSTGQPALRYPHVEAQQVSKGVYRAAGTQIHPSVQLTPPVCIGEGCQIGRDVTLGPNVVIGVHSVIDRGVTVQNSTVLDRTYIGKHLNVQWRIIRNTLLIDSQTGASTDVVDPLLLDEANPALALQMLRNGLERLGALILVLLLLPLLVLIGVVIWATSSGPAICTVPRIGKRPTTRYSSKLVPPYAFGLYRFRTRLADDRTNWFGAWLEHWELHRIPELWNIVRNDMGMVGVKPLTPHEADLMLEEWQQKRYEYQSGFTGLWYTQTNRDGNFNDICVADSYQAAMHTWHSDLQQLLYTPTAWWRRVQWRPAKSETIILRERSEFTHGRTHKLSSQRISSEVPVDPNT